MPSQLDSILILQFPFIPGSGGGERGDRLNAAIRSALKEYAISLAGNIHDVIHIQGTALGWLRSKEANQPTASSSQAAK